MTAAAAAAAHALRSRAIKEIYCDKKSNNVSPSGRGSRRSSAKLPATSDTTSSVLSHTGATSCSNSPQCAPPSSALDLGGLDDLAFDLDLDLSVDLDNNQPQSRPDKLNKLVRCESMLSIVSDGNCPAGGGGHEPHISSGGGDTASTGAASAAQPSAAAAAAAAAGGGGEPSRPELRLQFTQVCRPTGSRSRRAAAKSKQQQQRRQQQQLDREEGSSKNAAQQRRKRSATSMASPGGDLNSKLMRRDKKYLILNCDSPTVSQQSAVSNKVVGSPRRNAACAADGLVSDPETPQYSHQPDHAAASLSQMGHLSSPVSVLCPTSSNLSSSLALEPEPGSCAAQWSDQLELVDACGAPSMDTGVCFSTDQQLAVAPMPSSSDGLYEGESHPECHGQVQLLQPAPLGSSSSHELRIRSLMTSLLRDDIGSANVADDMHAPVEREQHLPLMFSPDGEGDACNLDVQQQPQGGAIFTGDPDDDVNFTNNFRHIDDFEVDFLDLLQQSDSDANDHCSSTAPTSTTAAGYTHQPPLPPPPCPGAFGVDEFQDASPTGAAAAASLVQQPRLVDAAMQLTDHHHVVVPEPCCGPVVAGEAAAAAAAHGCRLSTDAAPHAPLLANHHAMACAPGAAAATDAHQQHHAAAGIQHHWQLPPLASASDSPETNGIRLVHLLLAGAEAMATGNTDLVSAILVHLKDLSCKNGTTMQRVAAYFCEGLQLRVDQLTAPATKTGGGGASTHVVELGPGKGTTGTDPVADALGTFQILHEISPYIKFAHFTANQAILEAFENEKRVHIIDYDIMEGMQWPSLMQALALRPEGPPHLRITALCRAGGGSGSGGAAKRAAAVPASSLISTVQETGRRLSEFAASLQIPFSFHQAKVDAWENASGAPGTAGTHEFRPAVLKLVKGEALAVNCMLHLPHMATAAGRVTSLGAVHAFFTAMHKLSPAVMTVVEEELGCCFPAQGGPAEFVDFFFQTLHHYSAIFDSLEASLAPDSTVRHMVERIFLAPRITNLVANFAALGYDDAVIHNFFSSNPNHRDDEAAACSPGRAAAAAHALPSGLSEAGFQTVSCSQLYNAGVEDRGGSSAGSRNWSALAFASGFVPAQTSYKSQWQAKLLLSLFRDGYRLEQRGHRLVLGWRSFPLISASAWRCSQQHIA